jgi:secreted PhoX family phosphatase
MTQDNDASSYADFNEVLQLRLSRRGLLKGSLASASATYLGAGSLAASGSTAVHAAGSGLRLNFKAVAKSLDDLVLLPAGYSYKILLATLSHQAFLLTVIRA